MSAQDVAAPDPFTGYLHTGAKAVSQLFLRHDILQQTFLTFLPTHAAFFNGVPVGVLDGLG
jgi:hypothetical protein